MPGHRTKPKRIVDIETFGNDMSSVHKIINKYTSTLHTGTDSYRLLRDLHLQLCEVTREVSGHDELPWVAHLRGGNWPPSASGQ